MGVVSVLGPTGSLVGLINATGMLSKELYCLARGVRAARKDIRKFARKLSMFSWSSNEACSCLLRHYSNETGLDTLSNAKKKRFLKRAGESAEEILKDVENITPRILSMEPSGIELGLISKLRWYQRKSEVRDLTFEMGALQASLTLLMSTVTYEVQIRNKADPEALALTMAQITNFIEGAEVMASKFEKLVDGQRAADKTIKRLSMLLESVINVADTQLDDADEAREAIGLYEPGRWVLKKKAVPITHGSSNRRGSKMKTRIQKERTGSPQPSPSLNGRIFTRDSPVGKGKGKERQADHEVPEASSSRGVQNAPDNLGSENGRSIQPLATQLPQRAAMPYFSAPSASGNSEEINGYVRMGKNSESSKRIFKARLYPDFGMNAMSRAFAEELGLRVNALVDEEFAIMLPSAGSTQTGVNHSVGDVMLEWQTSTHILHLPCTVFEQEIAPDVPFALGKLYVQQVETARRAVRGESPRDGAAS